MFMQKKSNRWKNASRFFAPFLIAYFVGFPVVPVMALPQGENVRNGRVQFKQVGNTMLVLQQSGSAVVNYNSFNIGGGETVRFIQPSSSAAILNRVTGGGRSVIAGNLLANGQVYLINQNGILFSGSARVNVGGLVASGLNMTDSDFFARNLRFSGGGGSVINEGSISAGRVTMVGKDVENYGSIRGGRVTLAAGNSVVIDRVLGGDIRITIDGVEQPTVSGFGTQLAVPNGNAPNTNAAAPDSVITEEESIRALGEIATAPVITNGIVMNMGDIKVIGDMDGAITMRGVRVGQFGTATADGILGDGGDIGIYANELIIMGEESHTSANAGLFGNGGNVKIIANGLLGVQKGAYIGVRGGDKGGDGGFVDTSGHAGVDIQSFPDAIAPNGRNGYWLIDPPNFYIDDDGDRRDCNFLGFDCEVPIQFSETFNAIIPKGGNGYMDVDDLQDYYNDYRAMHIRTLGVGGGSSDGGQIILEHPITLNSGGDSIFILDGAATVFINGSISSGSGRDNIILMSNREVQINQAVNTGGGFLLVVAGRTTSEGEAWLRNNINTGGGYMTILSQQGQVIHNAGTINAGSGHVFFNAADTIFIESAIIAGRFTAAGNYIQQNGNGVLTIANDVLYQSASTVNMSAGSRVTSTSGDVFISAANQADVTGLRADAGTVAVAANFITDAGDSHADVAGLRALLLATNGNIGSANAIDTELGSVGGFASGGTIRISELASGGDLTIANIPAFDINAAQPITNLTVIYDDDNDRVSFVAQQTAPIDFPINAFTNGLVAQGNGTIEVTAQNGAVNVNRQIVHAGNGSVQINAFGANGDINVNDSVISLNSFVRLSAGDDINQNSIVGSGNNGYVSVSAFDDIVMNNSGLGFTGSGNIRYNANGDITLNNLISSNGNISVTAGGNLTQRSNIITLANGTIDVSVGGTITMLDQTLALVGNNRDIRYAAGGNIFLSSLISTQGDVSVRSTSGSIRDGGDTLPDIVGQNVMLSAPNGGIGQSGAGANGLEMAANNIAAVAGPGGINVAVGGNVNITTVGGTIGVNRVDLNGNVSSLNDGFLSGYTTTGGGPIVHLGNGATTISQPVSAGGTGNVAIINSSSNTVENIAINAPITSGSGNITIAADGTLIQNAGGDISTTGGDIVGVALGSNITMADGAETRSSGAGDILYLAKTNVVLGSLDSGNGTVVVVAQNGSIIDGGNQHKDVLGANAMLIALGGGVGQSNPIDTRIGTLAGFVQNGSFRVTEDDNLTIGSVGPVAINLVGVDGLTSLTNIPAIPGIFVTNGVGNIVITTLNGSITVATNGSVVNFADGDINLTANGFGSDVVVNGLIVGTDGNIRMAAADSIFQTTNILNTGIGWIIADAAGSIYMTNALTFAADGNILYDAGANATISSLITSNGNVSVLALLNIIQSSNIVAFGGGSVDVDSSLGSLTMIDGSLSYAPDGNIRYEAFSDVSLSSLITTQGNVAVFSTFGSILDSGDALPEVIAPAAQFTALNGGIGTMGTNGNPLEVVLTNLAARSGAGGINIINVGDLVIGDVPAVPVNRVQLDGSDAPIGGVFVSGLTTTNNGSISLVDLGSVTVDRLVTANGTGNIVIATATGTVGSLTFTSVDIIANTNISSGSGNITLFSGTDVIQNKNGNVLTGGGDISAVALAGDLIQVDGVKSATTGGDITYAAGTNIYLSSLQSGTGSIATISIDGDVLDNGDILSDVIGDGFFAVALNGNVGLVTNRIDTDINTLSGAALNGGMNILEDDDLEIAQVGPISMNLVLPNGVILLTNLPAFNGLVSSNGSLLVDTVLGDITVNGLVGSLSTNNLRLSANGGNSSLIINDTVYSADAPITLLAAGSVSINTSVVSRGSGTIDIEAFNGSIIMSDDGLVVAGEEDVRMFARQDVILGSVVATQSSVHVQATLGSILDGGDTLPEIIAARAQLVATNGSIGTLGDGTDNSLETGIGTLAALASAGGINIINGGDIVIGTVNDVVVQRVNEDDSLTQFNAGLLSGLVTTNNGSIVLIDVGDITVDDRVAADGTGNILLLNQTGTIASIDFGADMIINDTITSSSGHITAIAGQNFRQNVGGDISTDGDVGVVTRAGDLSQEDGVKATSGLGNMVFVAASNMLISAVHALTGSVTLATIDGTIYDNGDTDVDLIANEVQFFSAQGGVGTDTNGIETTISRVAALAGNGTFKITETDDLVIGLVNPIPVTVVEPDAGTSITNFPALSGIIVSNGNLLVDTIDGSITVDAAVLNGGSGNLLLEANGEGQDITANELIFAQNGNMTIVASNNVNQNNSILSAGVGTVDVLAEAGSITMVGTSTVSFAGDGAVRYQAREDVTITSLISPSNTVSVIAENGSIIDGGDDLSDVLAPAFRAVAGNGVGTYSNQIDTFIGFLSARGGTGGVHVANQSILVVDTIPDVVVNRVLLDGSTTSIVDLAQSDIVTTNGGSVSLQTVNGSIIVFDGEDPQDDVGIYANGGGFIDVSANGSNSFLLIDANVLSDLGDICLKADSHVIINTNRLIETGERGAIALWADNDDDGAGDIYQLGGTVKSQFGNIYYYGENIRLIDRSVISSVGGSISIKAGNDFTMSRQSRISTLFGSIAMEANNNLTINGQIRGGTVALTARRGSIKGGGKVTANELSMRANKNIGTARDSFDINTGTLALETKRGDVWLTEEDSVVIGPVPGIYLRFGVPFCCEDMPVANAQPLDQMLVAGRLEFNVGANLGGNVINVGDDAIIDVNGSVNGLQTLQAGGNILLTVNGNYLGNSIIAGGDLDAEIGGDLRFDLISAGRVDISARNIYMSRVIARSFANFKVGQNVFDDDSLITAPDIIMVAGGNIGPNAPINMNVSRIDTIQAGGNMDIVQLKSGDTFVNRLQAGGDMRVSLPNGGLVDRNGTSENLISSSATINARYIGTLSDPMEVRIVPGNLKVDGGGLSGEDTPESYVWIHLEGEIGKVGDRKIDYIGKKKIPGLIIYNNVILGGKDEILRRFKRASAFLGQVPRIIGPEGIQGADHYFLDMDQPGVGGWNVMIHYIVREMADITGLPEVDQKRTADKADPEAPAKAVERDSVKPVPLASVVY
jgi:filamentous hemagglutinin family protein